MTDINCKTIFKASKLLLALLLLQVSACTGQVKEKTVSDRTEYEVSDKHLATKQNTIFPQIHTNLNGMVRQFVRTFHQDSKGNYWFGTNGDGIIRYDGQTLEKITIADVSPRIRVLEIKEDKAGNVW
ncbi:MAG TPA: two-component regulator propeller domain-containing protein, partial [Saprospiraceae bacterium]|nr:two-component regulator propeller domain-containing protein [Saprospiraceae bacterium]